MALARATSAACAGSSAAAPPFNVGEFVGVGGVGAGAHGLCDMGPQGGAAVPAAAEWGRAHSGLAGPWLPRGGARESGRIGARLPRV